MKRFWAQNLPFSRLLDVVHIGIGDVSARQACQHVRGMKCYV